LPALPGARFWYSIGVCTWSVRDLCLVRGAGERRMSRGRIATRQRVQERCPRRARCGVLRCPLRCGKQSHVATAGRLHALWDMPRGAAMLDRAREGGSPPWRAGGFGGYRRARCRFSRRRALARNRRRDLPSPPNPLTGE
jgi:hypothetical protein